MRFDICRANLVGQTSCHGEAIDVEAIKNTLKQPVLELRLLAGKQEIATLDVPLFMGCVDPATKVPAYLDGSSYGAVSWNGGHTRILPIWKVGPLGNIGAFVVAARIEPSATEPGFVPPPRQSRAPHGVCLMGSNLSESVLDIIVPDQIRPVRRNFVILAAPDVIAQADGIEATVKAIDAQRS